MCGSVQADTSDTRTPELGGQESKPIKLLFGWRLIQESHMIIIHIRNTCDTIQKEYVLAKTENSPFLTDMFPQF